MKAISLVLSLLMAMPLYAGPTGTWFSNNTHQFFPPIIKALLGNGYALVPSQAFFGDCSDGNLTLGASGTTLLTRDMFYNNVSWPVGSTAQISFQNQRVFVCGTLDLTNAPVFGLDGSGASGVNGAAGGGGGSNGNTTAAGTNLTGRSGGNGGAGGTVTGTQGAVGVGGNVITSTSGGSGGAGGAGTGGAGGAARAAIGVTAFPMRDITTWFLPLTGTGAQIFVGGSGAGGAGGGGDVVNSGGGGGGGGASGQTVYLSANIIKTGALTGGATITAWGGQGGAGGSPAAGNTGGGGGGGGGAGGWIVVKYNSKVGSTVTALVSTPGGVFGSAGGTGHGTGVTGAAGNATPPGNGLIQILNLSTGQITSSTTGSANL